MPTAMAMASTPETRVSAPAVGLIVTGLLGALTGLGWMGLLALGGVAALGDPDAAEALGGIGVLLALGVLGVVISLFVAYAGLRMRRLRSWGLAMAGSILAMLPCGTCCVLGLPIGIWAILVLIDEEVKRAFGAGPAAPPDAGDDGSIYGPGSPPR